MWATIKGRNKMKKVDFNVDDVITLGFIYIGFMIAWLYRSGLEVNFLIRRLFFGLLAVFVVYLVIKAWRDYMRGESNG